MRRVLCCALFLAACRADYTLMEDLQSVVLADAVERVVVDVESGDVQILGRQDGIAESGIEVTSRWSRIAPTWDATVDNGVLRLVARCRAQQACGTDVRMWVPPAVAVEADTRAGGIVVGRTTGDLDARSDAGDIVIHTYDGEAHAETDAGNIALNESTGRADLWTGAGDVVVTAYSGERLDLASDAGVVSTWEVAVPVVIARTDSGAIEMTLDGALQRVVGETDGGAVTLDVPAGSYRLELEAEAGTISVDGVEHEPGADGVLHVQTDAGSIAVIGH